MLVALVYFVIVENNKWNNKTLIPVPALKLVRYTQVLEKYTVYTSNWP